MLLACGLTRRGWRVTVIALSGSGGDAAAHLQSHGVAFVSLKMRKGLADPRGWILLNRWLGRERPDVLHAHLPHAAWMARWSRLFAPVRVVIDTIHTAGTGTPGRRFGYRASNWLADQVTVVSGGAAEAWLAAGMISERKLLLLPNGVDTDDWCADPAVRVEVRRRLDICKEFLWLAAGRMERVKDFPTLLQAFAALPANARLLLAGGGSECEALQSLAASLGIAARVHFLGYMANVLPYMRAADGFVLSSLWEGLPMSLLEASACALPAVSTDVAGAAEILGPQQGAHLIPIQDSVALTAAMMRVMNLSVAERMQTGQAARLYVEKHFGLSVILDQWEALYAKLLARKKHAITRSGQSASACAQDAGADAK